MKAKILYEVVKNLKFIMQILSIHYLNYEKIGFCIWSRKLVFLFHLQTAEDTP